MQLWEPESARTRAYLQPLGHGWGRDPALSSPPPSPPDCCLTLSSLHPHGTLERSSLQLRPPKLRLRLCIVAPRTSLFHSHCKEGLYCHFSISSPCRQRSPPGSCGREDSHASGVAKELGGWVVRPELFPGAGTLPPTRCGSSLWMSTSLPCEAAQRTESGTCPVLSHPPSPSLPCPPAPWLQTEPQLPGPGPPAIFSRAVSSYTVPSSPCTYLFVTWHVETFSLYL